MNDGNEMSVDCIAEGVWLICEFLHLKGSLGTMIYRQGKYIMIRYFPSSEYNLMTFQQDIPPTYSKK